MSVTDAEDERRNTVTSTGFREGVDCLQILRICAADNTEISR